MADLNDLTQNINIWDDAKSKAVSIITDGSIERLAVDSKAKSEDIWQDLTFNGKAFITTTDVITISTITETDFVLFTNPSLSGKLIRFWEFLLGVSGTSGQRTIFRFYGLPTITSNGTSLPIYKIRPSQSQNSIALAYINPIISNRGTLINAIELSPGTFTRSLNLSRYLEENLNLLVTVDASAINLEHNLSLSWAEI